MAAFATSLSEIDWEMRLPQGARKVGVVMHHAASMYPLEIQLAGLLAAGEPIADLTWDAVDASAAVRFLTTLRVGRGDVRGYRILMPTRV